MSFPTRRDESRRKEAAEVVSRGLDHLGRLQEERGGFRGEYGGPMFLLPMYIGLCHVAGRLDSEPHRPAMVRYLRSALNPDGSAGLYDGGPGCTFTSALVYVALRLLGEPPDAPPVARLRQWLRARGGPLGAAPWGKLMLAVLGLYAWEGLHPILPELWLLPDAAPVHPGRLWCHCRQVYLPMAWLYGMRAECKEYSLRSALREELYGMPYDAIPFADHRDTIDPGDSYRPLGLAGRLTMRALGVYEARASQWLRGRALDRVLTHLRYEDEVTSYLRIGPVNAVLNTLCLVLSGRHSAEVERSFEALSAYLWEGPRGVLMQSYNSTELWDTAFAIQAIRATPFWRDHLSVLRRAHAFLRDNQIVEDVPDAAAHYRHASRGGWPFSDRPHGWPITDCTAEGLKCAIALEGLFSPDIPEPLLRDAVRLLLTWQNDDGGFGTYERQRAGAWMEQLNPAFVFGDIMVDYSHVECTSAVIQALMKAKVRFPGPFDRAIDRSVAHARRFLAGRQRDDGSFEGAWGVCFTYGTWFGISGLLAAGQPTSAPAIRRAVQFLLAHQQPSGAWGEHPRSCIERRYIDHPQGQVVMTSWALLGLVRARCEDRDAMARAVDFLVSAQPESGGYPAESMAGVFNRTCMINYDNYRHYFPVWALGEWLALDGGAPHGEHS
ncbi:MAG: terpene cyclase/mutase family protein [Polyangiaceae bacterium]